MLHLFIYSPLRLRCGPLWSVVITGHTARYPHPRYSTRPGGWYSWCSFMWSIPESPSKDPGLPIGLPGNFPLRQHQYWSCSVSEQKISSGWQKIRLISRLAKFRINLEQQWMAG